MSPTVHVTAADDTIFLKSLMFVLTNVPTNTNIHITWDDKVIAGHQRSIVVFIFFLFITNTPLQTVVQRELGIEGVTRYYFIHRQHKER